MSSNVAVVSPESTNTRRSRSSSDSSPQKSKQTKSPRKTTSLPPETVEYLKNWMMSPEHIAHPYPTEHEKAQIMADTGIELKQLTNWFVNNRKRYWKPRVEARLQQQAQAQVAARAAAVAASHVVSPMKFGAPYIALDMTQPQQIPRRVSMESHEVGNTNDNDSVQAVNSEAFATVDRTPSPRAVSVSSSSISESDNSSFSNETDDDLTCEAVDEVDTNTQTVKRNEYVDIHILRPMGNDPVPTIEDVTILPDIPSDRILRSYRNCSMSYRLPFDGFADKKRARSRRDAEIVKIKKQYLKRFLQETATVAAALLLPESETQTTTPRKRPRSNEDDQVEAHRPKYLRKNTDLWREACVNARDMYDRELPSLEEASHLFGFTV